MQSNFRSSGRVTSEDTGERRGKGKGKKRDAGGQAGQGGSSRGTQGKTETNEVKVGKGGSDNQPDSEDIWSKNGESSKNPNLSQKRSTESGLPNGKAKNSNKVDIPSIQPNESLGEYNRRVESLLRPGVSKAIKAANGIKADQEKQAKLAKEERKRKAKAQALGELAEDESGGGAKTAGKRKLEQEDIPTAKKGKVADGEKRGEDGFKSLPGPRRLNDVAQQPPQLPHMRVSGTKKDTGIWSAKGKGSSGLSAAQERILGEERERVIKRYREMKAERGGGTGAMAPLPVGGATSDDD